MTADAWFLLSAFFLGVSFGANVVTLVFQIWGKK